MEGALASKEQITVPKRNSSVASIPLYILLLACYSIEIVVTIMWTMKQKRSLHFTHVKSQHVI